MARSGEEQDLPMEADPADVAEQAEGLASEQEPGEPFAGGTDAAVPEADEGDLVEQRLDVPGDDEDEGPR